jgi:hypothetical protein
VHRLPTQPPFNGGAAAPFLAAALDHSLARPGDGGRPVRDSELGVAVVEVLLDGPGRDPEAFGDGRVGQPAATSSSLTTRETLELVGPGHADHGAQPRGLEMRGDLRLYELEHGAVASRVVAVRSVELAGFDSATRDDLGGTGP